MPKIKKTQDAKPPEAGDDVPNELADDELENVAGGSDCIPKTNGIPLPDDEPFEPLDPRL